MRAYADNRDGQRFYVGVWDMEPEIKDFKTLGAKKYLCSFDGKNIEATISGVSKDIGAAYFTEHGFDAFTDSTTIPVSGKVSAHYNTVKPHEITINGVTFTTASNIALIEASYTINITHDFAEFIKMVNNTLEFYKQQK